MYSKRLLPTKHRSALQYDDQIELNYDLKWSPMMTCTMKMSAPVCTIILYPYILFFENQTT